MTMPAAPAAHLMTARSPEDVLAAVPIVLGFVPEESVVMLTFGAEHQFHARLDLPVSAAERDACAEALLEPVLRHGAAAALFVLYTDDAELAAPCARGLREAFERQGVDVLVVLRSDGSCWFEVPVDPADGEGAGTPYDVSGHVFTAAAVATGRVTLPSRAELAASVAADPEAVGAVEAERVRSPGDQLDEHQEAAWVLAMIGRLHAQRARADPATSARLLLALREATVRDSLLGSLDRRGADRLLPVLSALVRAAPTDLVAPAASVVAFAAWLAGDGALAWCALDRAAEGDPGCALADRVAEVLQRALPPACWEERR